MGRSSLLIAGALIARVLFGPIDAVAQTDSSTVPPYLAQPPKLLELVQADVPKDTEYPSATVDVLLRIEVTATGTVSEVAVLEGAGEPFDGAARAAAQRFTFEPGVASTGDQVPVTITFRLTIEAPPRPPPAATPPPPDPVLYTGRIIERGTRRPLLAIEVEVFDGERVVTSTLTDAEGNFRLAIQLANFSLRAEPLTHEPLIAEVNAKPGESITETFYLEAISNPYETIVRARAVKREVIQRTISPKEVERVAGTTGDTIKAVLNLPGVARSAFDGGLLVLRGSAPGDSGTFLEQQEIPQIYHFGGLRSTFNSAFLEELSFIPGNFGPEYGRFVGGVVDVRVRDPADDLFRGSVDINVYDASIVLEGPVHEKVAVGGAFRRSYIDAVLPAVIPEDAAISFDTAPRFYDYQLLTSYKPNARHDVKAIWYGSRDRLEILFEDPQGDPKVRGTLSTNVSFHNLHLSARSKLSDRVRQEVTVVGSTQKLSFSLGQDFFFDLDVKSVSARGTWTVDAADWLELRGGVDARYRFVNISLAAPYPPKEGENPPPLSVTEAIGLERKRGIVEPAIWVEGRIKATDSLLIVPSLRTDFYEANGQFTVDPRLLAEYELSDKTRFKSGVGLYQQQPQYDESSEGLGNPDLLAERSVQATLGVQHNLLDAIDIDVTGFYKWLDRLVVRDPLAFADPDRPPYTNDGTGRIFGLELLVRARFGDEFFGWIAYTFQRSFRTDQVGDDERLFDFDQPHILTAVASYEIGRGWAVGARFRLVSGNPTTPIDGALYDAVSDVFFPLYGRQNSDRLGTFHQLDVRVDKVWTFETWTLNLYLDIQNFYNRGNPEGYIYNFDFSERDTLTGLPILPILGIKGQW